MGDKVKEVISHELEECVLSVKAEILQFQKEKQRLEKREELLKDGVETIKQLAEALGFKEDEQIIIDKGFVCEKTLPSVKEIEEMLLK